MHTLKIYYNNFFYSGYQKIQRNWGWWNCKKKYLKRDKNVKIIKVTSKYRRIERSLQTVFILISKILKIPRKGRIYLVFEYVEKNLLEVLEESPDGL